MSMVDIFNKFIKHSRSANYGSSVAWTIDDSAEYKIKNYFEVFFACELWARKIPFRELMLRAVMKGVNWAFSPCELQTLF